MPGCCFTAFLLCGMLFFLRSHVKLCRRNQRRHTEDLTLMRPMKSCNLISDITVFIWAHKRCSNKVELKGKMSFRCHPQSHGAPFYQYKPNTQLKNQWLCVFVSKFRFLTSASNHFQPVKHSLVNQIKM